MFPSLARAAKYLRLFRGLRYRTLEAALQRAVEVRSEASVVQDVLGALGDVLPRGLGAAHALAPGLPTVAKYALLDLEIPLSADEGGHGARRLSRRELEALGLLGAGQAAPYDPSLPEECDSWIDQMLEEMANGLCVKVILDAEADRRSVEQRIIDVQRGLSPGYLPAVFRVRDCCVTNAPSIWLEKHLYV